MRLLEVMQEDAFINFETEKSEENDLLLKSAFSC